MKMSLSTAPCLRLTALVVFMVLSLGWANSAENATLPCFCLEEVKSGLYNPVDYVQTTGHDNLPLALVVEQRGVVRAFNVKEAGFSERDTPFLNITDRVRTSSASGEERGLLGFALHPNYGRSNNGQVFVSYIGVLESDSQDYSYVSEFQASGDVVDVTSERKLLRIKQPNQTTNGGQLVFGDDGYLYIFTGDGSGVADSPNGHAQDLQSFLGKALRIDVSQHGFTRGDSASALMYDRPADNPFYADLKAKPEIFALGLRNPWRCTQDSQGRGGTGDIYCGDVGSDFFDEINMIKKGGNYGWNLKEGDLCFNSTKNCTIGNEEEPVFTIPHSSEKDRAVVGGFVYRGKAFKDLNGTYVYGDATTGQTFYLKKDQAGQWGNSTVWAVCPSKQCPEHGRRGKLPFLLAFGLDTNGELMLLMTSQLSVHNDTGKLFRITAPTTTGKPPVGSTCNLTAGPLLTLLCILVAFLLHDAGVTV